MLRAERAAISLATAPTIVIMATKGATGIIANETENATATALITDSRVGGARREVTILTGRKSIRAVFAPVGAARFPADPIRRAIAVPTTSGRR